MSALGMDVGYAFDRALRARPALRREEASVGFDLFNPSTYHEVVDNPGKVVSEAASNLTHPDVLKANAARSLGPVLQAADVVASNAIALVSLIPGLGTGVAAALSAGLAALEGGSPLAIAIKVAYGALPIPPGIKVFTDIVLNGVLALIDNPRNLGAAALAGIRNTLLAKVPDVAKSMAASAFDTLAHLILGALESKPTLATTAKKLAPAAHKTIQLAHRAARPLPPHVTPIPPKAQATLAVHIGLALKPPAAASSSDRATLVRTLRPQIVRSTVLLPARR